jgi:hypothetical protein
MNSNKELILKVAEIAVVNLSTGFTLEDLILYMKKDNPFSSEDAVKLAITELTEEGMLIKYPEINIYKVDLNDLRWGTILWGYYGKKCLEFLN